MQNNSFLLHLVTCFGTSNMPSEKILYYYSNQELKCRLPFYLLPITASRFFLSVPLSNRKMIS